MYFYSLAILVSVWREMKFRARHYPERCEGSSDIRFLASRSFGPTAHQDSIWRFTRQILVIVSSLLQPLLALGQQSPAQVENFSAESSGNKLNEQIAIQNILVIGVIANSDPNQGVALLKDVSTQRTFAIKSGSQVTLKVFVDKITRDYVHFRNGDHIEKVRVGDQFDAKNMSAPQLQGPIVISEGIERTGNTVKVSSSLVESISGPSLGTILMQAAAVPHLINGELRGFGLFEIEKESIFQKAGFLDGDVITSINGQSLSDVGSTIKLLHTLKNESRVEVNLTRDGQDQTLVFEVK